MSTIGICEKKALFKNQLYTHIYNIYVYMRMKKYEYIYIYMYKYTYKTNIAFDSLSARLEVIKSLRREDSLIPIHFDEMVLVT